VRRLAAAFAMIRIEQRSAGADARPEVQLRSVSAEKRCQKKKARETIAGPSELKVTIYDLLQRIHQSRNRPIQFLI
jgi:hypothetical protein